MTPAIASYALWEDDVDGWMSTLGIALPKAEDVVKFENAWRSIEAMMKLVLDDRGLLLRHLKPYLDNVVRERDEMVHRYTELQQRYDALSDNQRRSDVADKEVLTVRMMEKCWT